MSLIKSILQKMFEEAAGEISMVRIMSLLSLLTGIGVGIYGVIQGKDLSGLSQVCAVFIGSAFLGKTASKFAERE